MSTPAAATPDVVARIGIYLYPDMTQLDALGPQQALSMCPGLEVFTFARTTDPVVTDSGLTLLPDHGFDDLPLCDVLLVGGTGNPYPQMNDPVVLSTLARIGRQARYVTSVCTGSLILAAAGLLDGYRAGTHWAYREILAGYPEVQQVDDRVVVDRDRVSGGGVTAGIDFALSLIGILVDDQTAQLVQLVMEYDPAPPYNAGHPDVAPAEVVEVGRALCAQMAPDLFGARPDPVTA